MKISQVNKRIAAGGFSNKVTWDYEPTFRQKLFHEKKATFKLYGGAFGGGKTVALCAEAIKQSLIYPGNRGYFCRHQLVDFKRSSLVSFLHLCPSELLLRHYREDRIFVFRNGSEMVYGGLGAQEDLDRIKSTEFGWFAVDEATETFEEMYLLLCSRLRWKLPTGEFPVYHGLLASNPEPGWVKERFVDQNLDDHEFVPALPRDNPHLPGNYAARLRAMYPIEWVRRYLEGSWDVFEGQIYKEFDQSRHVYSGTDIGKYWEKFRIIDHGYVNPTCCLWAAIDFDGVMWIYDEHYEKEKIIAEHADAIKKKHPDFEGITLCDPSMFSRTMQKAGKIWTPADEYRENGIICISPYGQDGRISEEMGINLVKARMIADKIRIHERCVNTIKEILKYHWNKPRLTERIANLPETPVDRDNHAMDCLRYGCLWRPVASAPPSPPVSTKSLHWAIVAHKRHQQLQGRFAGW